MVSKDKYIHVIKVRQKYIYNLYCINEKTKEMRVLVSLDRINALHILMRCSSKESSFFIDPKEPTMNKRKR